jgi:hypothetical protein
VTWDVEQITRSDGTRAALVTGGANSITVGRRGLYGYVLTNADLTLYDYVFTAITAGTVDQNEVAAMWTYFDIHALRPTTAGRTLDVDANGGAEIDAAQLAALVAALEAAISTLAIANAAAIATSGVTGSLITIYNYTTATITLSGLPDITGWDKLWFTGKRNKTDDDAEALFHVALTSGLGDANDGLQYLNGATATKTDGFIEVLSSTSIKITIKASAMSQLAAITGAFYGIKKMDGTDILPVSEGGTLDIKNVTPRAIA